MKLDSDLNFVREENDDKYDPKYDAPNKTNEISYQNNKVVHRQQRRVVSQYKLIKKSRQEKSKRETAQNLLAPSYVLSAEVTA